MVKPPAPHPTLVTRRLRLRQFSNEDVDAMHECFADPEAMRFWNTPVHSKRIETERATGLSTVPRPTIASGRSRTPRPISASEWSTTMTAISAPSVWPSGISLTPHVAGRASAPRRSWRCSNSALAILEYIACRPSSIPTMQRLANWSRSSGSAAKDASVTIYAWVTNGATTCCMRCLQPSAQAKLDLMLALLISTHRPNRGGGDLRSFLSPIQGNQPLKVIFLQRDAAPTLERIEIRFA